MNHGGHCELVGCGIKEFWSFLIKKLPTPKLFNFYYFLYLIPKPGVS